MVWNLEPDDPPEPGDVDVALCNDCNQPQDYGVVDVENCNCENYSGYHIENLWRCYDCRLIYKNEDAWAEHICDGPSYDYYGE